MTAAALRGLLDRVGDALDDMGPFDHPEEEADAHHHLLRLCSAARPPQRQASRARSVAAT